MPTPPLSNTEFDFVKTSHHASFNFSQTGRSLYRNQPRLPFEYYINIQLNNVGTAKTYIQQYFNTATWLQLAPLVKNIEMPSFKIETTPLNQYNRKRLSQTKIAFEPVKVVFHDVADGKTLKFWDMYYRYYFGDGTEPGMNSPKQSQNANSQYSTETLLNNISPAYNPNVAGNPSSRINSTMSNAPTGANSPNDTIGNKQDTQNIISDALSNHNFGFNLPTVQNIRNLIQNIQIYQVHAGRFNQVTLVNPRISAFTHDVLNYAVGDKTLELTFTFEYEYAYYTIQNMQLNNADTGAGGQSNNLSTIDQYTHGDFLDFPTLAFNASLLDFIESNNSVLSSSNPILSRIGNNTQSSLGTVSSAYATSYIRGVSTSSLGGLVNIAPPLYNPPTIPVIQTRPFASSAPTIDTSYQPYNLSTGNGSYG
jgi:hypothetical protein